MRGIPVEFLKKFNNNVALVLDSTGIEWIVIGKGIGFNAVKGEPVDKTMIDRRFIAEPTHGQIDLLQTIASMDPEIIDVVSDVTKEAETYLGITFSTRNYITLADHLNYALKRTQEGVEYTENLRWEVKKLYPKEYEAALKAIETINKRLSITLPKSEETFITYHFVNAQNDEGKIENTVKMTKLINRILEVVKYHFQIELDEESLNYVRFLTHLRYFIIRQTHGEPVHHEGIDQTVLEAVKAKYLKAYEAAEKISTLLNKQEDWSLSSDEMLYLTLHIFRVTNRIHQENT